MMKHYIIGSYETLITYSGEPSTHQQYSLFLRFTGFLLDLLDSYWMFYALARSGCETFGTAWLSGDQRTT